MQEKKNNLKPKIVVSGEKARQEQYILEPI